MSTSPEAMAAARRFRETVAGAGATATIVAGDQEVRIAPDGISGHVTKDPTHRPYVPHDEAFADGADFLPAREITAIGDALIARWPELAFLEEAEITYLWKRSGGKTRGKAVFGTCVKPAGLVRYFSRADFIVWIAADHVRAAGLTNLQLEALVYHELNHAGWEVDETEGSPTYGETKYVLKGHDNELFYAELRRYGAWHHAHQGTLDVWRQLAIDAASSPDPERLDG